MSQLRTRVENAIASVLPHARSLGRSERTLARKLSDEGLNRPGFVGGQVTPPWQQ